MAATERPEDFRCPVWGCRAAGARWVVLHEHWRLAPCAAHADEIEANPVAWRIVNARDGVLRFARTDEAAPDGWREPEQEAAGGTRSGRLRR